MIILLNWQIAVLTLHKVVLLDKNLISNVTLYQKNKIWFCLATDTLINSQCFTNLLPMILIAKNLAISKFHC